METLIKDLRFSVRALASKPGFTFVVVLTLALGIGANTAIFSFINALLLQPLPFREPDRLVRIESIRGSERGRISMLEIEDMKQLQSFEDVAAFIPGAQYNMSGDGPPEEAPATLATGNLVDVLGISLIHGEMWPKEYDLERNFGVALSYDLWRRRFGGDPSIIGQKITLDAAPFYTVFGVLPPDIKFPNEALLLRSIAINQAYPNYKARDARNVYGLARLRPGVSHEQARAEIESLGHRLEEIYPGTNSGLRFNITPLPEFYTGNIRPYLLLLLGAVAFVLAIACGNVVNLLLSHALAREREVAIKTALGAGRGRLVGQFLTESLLLALAGGAAGVALAWWWVGLLSNMIELDLPSWMRIRIDSTVLVFALAVSVITGVLAGIAPALHASRPDLNNLLKEGSRGSSAETRQRLRRMLVVAEVSLALALLAGAGLMARSFLNLQRTDLGFKSDNILTFRVALPWRKYNDDKARERMAAFYTQSLERLAALPGVESVAVTSNLPLSGETETGKITFTVEGQSFDEQQRNPYVNDLQVSPNYFDLMGIPLLAGRFFSHQDTSASQPVAIISRRMAERIFAGEEAIGRRLKVGPVDSQGRWLIIVGIVGDTRHEEITGDAGIDLYVSYLQFPDANMYALIRTRVPPMSLANAAEKIIWSVDAEQATFDIQSMEDRIASRIWQQRLSGTLFVIFACLAVALAAIGIYGVISYAVSRRTREIGIRRALGAQTSAIIRMVVGESLKLVGVGIVVGLAAALAMARLMKSLLYGVSAADPLIFSAAPLILALVALIAGLIPAARAARVDPMIALRHD